MFPIQFELKDMKRRQDEEQMRQQDIIEKQKAEQDRGRYAKEKKSFSHLSFSNFYIKSYSKMCDLKSNLNLTKEWITKELWISVYCCKGWGQENWGLYCFRQGHDQPDTKSDTSSIKDSSEYILTNVENKCVNEMRVCHGDTNTDNDEGINDKKEAFIYTK